MRYIAAYICCIHSLHVQLKMWNLFLIELCFENRNKHEKELKLCSLKIQQKQWVYISIFKFWKEIGKNESTYTYKNTQLAGSAWSIFTSAQSSSSWMSTEQSHK